VRVKELEPDPDTATAVHTAVNYVNRRRRQRPGSRLYIERRVDPGSTIGRDDLWGTGDIILAWPDLIEIADYKHGKGVVVEIVGNLQLRLYAAGALAMLGPVPTIRTTIIQPRAEHADGPVRSADYTVDEIHEFMGWIKDRAADTDAPDAPLVPGAWCNWCAARQAGTCPIQREKALAKGREELAAISFPTD
jgi:hypothetical protein